MLMSLGVNIAPAHNGVFAPLQNAPTQTDARSSHYRRLCKYSYHATLRQKEKSHFFTGKAFHFYILLFQLCILDSAHLESLASLYLLHPSHSPRYPPFFFLLLFGYSSTHRHAEGRGRCGAVRVNKSCFPSMRSRLCSLLPSSYFLLVLFLPCLSLSLSLSLTLLSISLCARTQP